MSRRRTPNSDRSKTLTIYSQSAVSHILQHCPERILELLISNTRNANSRLDSLKSLAQSKGIPFHDFHPRPEETELVRAKLAPFVYGDLGDLIGESKDWDNAVVLALDHIQDPQNLGAICRTAEGLGAKAILIPKDRGVSVGSGVYHASVGAVETIPLIQVTNLSEAVRRLKDNEFWIVGTELSDSATTPWEIPDFKKVVLVLGSELTGLSAGISKHCDWKVKIPIVGSIDSLNVGVAGAICLYEWLRRQSAPPSLPET